MRNRRLLCLSVTRGRRLPERRRFPPLASAALVFLLPESAGCRASLCLLAETLVVPAYGAVRVRPGGGSAPIAC
jgi:hypothetical protein